MKGVIFNLLEKVVSEAHGEGVWEEILAAADLDGAYSAVGSYPDEHLFSLVRAASARLEVDDQELIRWFGRSAIPLLAESYPQFFAEHRSLGTFLPTLNDVIHPEVRKLYPQAIVPEFDFRTTDDHRITMVYDSPRRLCALAEGFVQGAAAHFSETVELDQPECMLSGDTQCVLELSFHRA